MDKLEGIEEGDTVEVAFTAKVVELPPEYLLLKIGDALVSVGFDQADIASPSFSIKKVEPPIAVGSRVRYQQGYSDRNGGFSVTVTGTIRAIEDGVALVKDDPPYTSYSAVRLTHLERAS
jgi:hypothetical protein